MRGLAYRRAQEERAYRKALRLLTRDSYSSRQYPGSFKRNVDMAARAMRNTRTPCSCPMCGNPRKWHGDLTMAEIKAIDSYRIARYELVDAGNQTTDPTDTASPINGTEPNGSSGNGADRSQIVR